MILRCNDLTYVTNVFNELSVALVSCAKSVSTELK